jgi:hypothetical protein
MIRIEIRNFQSLEHAVITVRGFTALVGRSNIGKSAIIRAVEAALSGASGTSFVRHGPKCARRLKDIKNCKCYASVHIVGDGMDLLWEKGDGVNRYRYNGKDYDAVARGFPEFLKPDFTPIKVGDKQVQLQIATQWEPIFLLNTSGGTVADVLSDVARLDRINMAMRLSEKDRKAAMATLKVRGEDAARLKLSLAGYDGLDDAVRRARLTETRLKEIEGYDRRVCDLEGFIASTGILATRIRELEGVTQIAIPPTTPVFDKVKALTSLTGFRADYEVKATTVAALEPVTHLQPPAPEPVRQAQTSFASLSGWLTKVRALKVILVGWEGVQAAPVPEVARLTGKLEAARKAATLASRLALVETSLASLEKQYDGVLAEEHGVQEEVRKLGTCPSCARPFHGEHHEASISD